MITASNGVAAVLAETTTEIAEHHEAPMEWWAVGLVTIGAIVLLGVVITIMTMYDRKRHPHS